MFLLPCVTDGPPRPPLPSDTMPPRPPPPETDDEDDMHFPIPQENQPIMVRTDYCYCKMGYYCITTEQHKTPLTR